MGLKDSLVSMMGDFVQMNKNPDFRSKSDLVQPSASAEVTGRASPRRHSLSITVGTGVTDNVRQRTFSITPEMQKHLEAINKRALKKGAATADDSDSSLRQRIDSDSDKYEEAVLAARYRQRPRRRSEPVAMGLEPVKEHKSSRKSAHRSKDGKEKKSRRKTSDTSGSRSRSGSKHSVSNSRKNSAAYNSKIDEEEDGAEEVENNQVFSQSTPTVHRLAHHNCGGSAGGTSRGSPSSGPPTTPIPEDWEAERSHAEHYARGGGTSMNALIVELKNIEKANEDGSGKQPHSSSSAKGRENDAVGGRKTSCASRKSSIGIYPPPVALLTNITRF